MFGFLDFKGAAKALIKRKPVRTTGRLALARRRHGRLWPLLGSAALVAILGTFLIASALSLEALSEAGTTGSQKGSFAAELRSSHLQIRLLAELGFAFMIAAIVAFFIEAFAKRDQTHLLDEAIQDIGHSVIEGVYGIRHDKEYIRTVVNNCLAVRHIRRDYIVTCTVSEFTDDECKSLQIIPGSLLKIEAELTYLAVNIGNDTAVFDGRYYIPKRSGKLDAFTKMTFLRVGDKTYDPMELPGLEISQQDESFISSDRGYSFEIPAPPEMSVQVHIRSVFAKERSDNEIFAYLFPTIGSTIRFIFQVDGLRIGAKARTATDMPDTKNISAGKYVEWKIDGPLLPNNYVTVWWRSAADDGEAASNNLIANVQSHPSPQSIPPAAGTDPIEGTSSATPSLPTRSKWASAARKFLPPWR